MNKRFVLTLLGLGVIVIVSLLGFCTYKMHGFKLKLQETLNTNLAQISQDIQPNEVQLKFEPFKCSGFFFIECKSPYITFYSQEFNQEIFASRNIILSLKEIDFSSVTLNAQSHLELAKIDQLQDYTQAFFPQSFNLDLTIKPQKPSGYTMHSILSLSAQNVEFKGELTSIVDSPKVREVGLFSHISSFAFLNEGLQIKNLEFSLISKNLSEKLFEILKSKYGTSLNKQTFIALATLMASASIESYSNRPYFQEIKNIVSGLLGIALGKTHRIELFISPKTSNLLDSKFFNIQNLDNILEKIFLSFNVSVEFSE